MNKENASKLWKMMQEAGDYLRGSTTRSSKSSQRQKSLCPCCYMCTKSKFNQSYKDIDDNRFQEVLDYIEFLKKNPS